MKKQSIPSIILFALIKTTAMVDSISGKLNGTVFAKNKGGAYIRSKSTVANPQTPAQSAVRAIFANISQLWRTLDPEERQSWNEGAAQYPYQNRLGDAKIYSGKALFQKLNGNLLNVGLPIDTTLNAPAAVVGITDMEAPLVVDDDTGVITFTMGLAATLTAPGQRFVLEATPSLSAGIDNANTKFRSLAVSDTLITGSSITESTFATDGAALLGAYAEKFGTPQAGAKVFFRVKAVNLNGQDSPYFTTSAIATD